MGELLYLDIEKHQSDKNRVNVTISVYKIDGGYQVDVRESSGYGGSFSHSTLKDALLQIKKYPTLFERMREWYEQYTQQKLWN